MKPCTVLAPGVAWPYSPEQPKPTGHKPRRFTPEQADAIRFSCKEGMKRKDVAWINKVSVSTIDTVIRRTGAYKKDEKCLPN